MTLFARNFLLVFAQLGVGGLLALAVPPFHEIERGYFKSSGGVFLSASLAGGGGTLWLWLTRASSGVSTLEAVLWIAHLAAFMAYLATLWGEYVILRARAFVVALLTGLATLAIAATSAVGDVGTVGDLLAIATTYASAGAVGSVTAGMLIGHWYLIDPGMELEPFHRCFRYFRATILAQLVVLAASLLAMWLVGAARGDALAGMTPALVATRVLLGPIAALGASELIRRVLAIPQTMAATGLFYVATLAVLVGEMAARYATFRTGWPF